MPVSENSPGLTLGRSNFDPRQFPAGTDQAIISTFARNHTTHVGAGWPSAAKAGDPIYFAVYAQPDGEGAHILYGGNPQDPTNPHVLTVSASGSATVIWQEEGSTVKTSGTVNFVGDSVTVTDEGDGKATVTITGGGGGGSTNAFGTIQVSGQSDVVADAAPDALTVVAGTGMVITTNAGSDSMTFAIDTATVAQNSFTTIAVSGQSNVVADGPNDTLTLVAGSNVTITTNAGSDSVTIAATDTDTTYTGGAGIDLDGTEFRADPFIVSHLDFVEPFTGVASSIDNPAALLAIKWNDIENYGDDADQILGHYNTDSWPPGVSFQSVPTWLQTLPGYSSGQKQVLTNDMGTIEWKLIDEVLEWLAEWDAEAEQSIGHEIDGPPLWQNDTNECPE